MADNPLFRKAAMEKLASPERLDVLMQVTSPVGWIAIITVMGILACAIAWSILGSIPERLEAQGILMRGGGLREVRSSGDGVITKLDLKLNDTIKAEQLIAEVSAGVQADDSTKAARAKLDAAQRELQMGSIDDQSAKGTLTSQKINYQSELDRANGELAKFNEDLSGARERLSKGLITKARVDAIEMQVSGKQSQISALKNQISNVDAQIRGLDERMRPRQRAVEAAKLELEQTLHTVAEVTRINATVEGRVVEVKKNVGDRVRSGEVMAVVEPPSSMLEPIVFVNSSSGKRIKPGMEAQISPSTVKREEFGFMKGTVKSVGDYPVTPEAAMGIIANPTLVQELIGSTAKLEMHAALVPDPKAPSGFQWSSSSGPPFKVDTGTRVTVSVVVDRKRPISKVLPIFKALGSS
ncbi:MAG TPA: NHLP bacteriocin system secretion protein [Vicinamibacterales bacterium]|nr:NHLP bacteriocin system secretion protein [Vicinamibacterales bacterium]